MTDEEAVLPPWATEERLRQIYDISEFLPEIGTRVTEITLSSDRAIPAGAFDVYAEHFDAKEEELAAVFWRQFWPPDEDRPWFTVVHASYVTEGGYRKRGIATANYTCSLARYTEIGVRRILIPAVGAGRTFLAQVRFWNRLR